MLAAAHSAADESSGHDYVLDVRRQQRDRLILEVDCLPDVASNTRLTQRLGHSLQ